MTAWAPLPRDFYRRDAVEVAPSLLNKAVICGERVARIVEVEAYRGRDDPASHAFRGLTRRNATMWGPPGYLYVYFTYGMHWCANVVCGEEGVAQAVLLRALAPVCGIEAMREAREALRPGSRPGGRRNRDLMSGPAKTCAALDLGGEHDGADLVSGDRGVWLAFDGTEPPEVPGNGPRIGLSVATEVPWRWWVPGDPNLSRRG